MLRDISYRYKIPATIIAVIVVTALAIAIPLISSANDAAKRDLIEHALSLGKTLSRSVQPAMLHDELWQAYEIVTTPLDRPLEESVGKQAIILLDAQGAIYVASDPKRFPSLETFAQLGEGPAKLSRAISEQGEEPLVFEN